MRESPQAESPSSHDGAFARSVVAHSPRARRLDLRQSMQLRLRGRALRGRRPQAQCRWTRIDLHRCTCWLSERAQSNLIRGLPSCSRAGPSKIGRRRWADPRALPAVTCHRYPLQPVLPLRPPPPHPTHKQPHTLDTEGRSTCGLCLSHSTASIAPSDCLRRILEKTYRCRDAGAWGGG